MCGRFTLQVTPQMLSEVFGLSAAPSITPRYNIAPGQQIPVVRNLGGNNHLDYMKWGLIPSWAQDTTIGYKLINARSETIFEKHSFRRAIRTRRCLVPASGFYEWKHFETRKVPYYISLSDNPLMAFAGIWEQWKTPDNNTLESVAIITTAANKLLSEIHDRMPVILHPQEYDLWLDRSISDQEILQPLFKPYPSEVMQSYEVSPLVNNTRNDIPDCISATTT